ncbi:galactocerebrosidase-like isoform X3 [Dreissena polymorpha]|uniref:galactocerebrosidase-like isoform X3 n=1 Tax=Dreissena polymorpha TaxID=45954 RepID=UPI0022643C7E|nr:galactocerebrosidase-like isoform X3 [Dreissena polymorpha]
MSPLTVIVVLYIISCVNFLNAYTTYNVIPTKDETRRFYGIGGLSGGGRTTHSDVYVVKTDNLKRRFLGIGGLSAGATSKLLVNYPEQQRNEILDYLFKPEFGASLQILKVEIGGDAQSTDGTEASHMHYPWDENYQRGYEWWLMVEAKKRNPGIMLYCLPWAFPAWVGDGKRDPYNNPNLTASYVVKWIQGARKYYNLTMDYVGVWNERPYNAKYIKTLRQMLDNAGLDQVQIVAADGLWEPIAIDIQADKELAKAVDIIGVHYPGTKTTQMAIDTGKPLWSSEDYSTFNDNVGAGCWARILNQNYVNGFMTSTISWNLIASYYEALPFARDGLMTADSPWSGYYRVDAPIWITAHTTQFTYRGFYYTEHGSGSSLLKEGGSMVSLVSFDNIQLTIIIETMSRNHSVCIRPFLPEYDVKPQNISIQLTGYFAELPSLFVRYSKLGFDGEDSILFKDMGTIPVTGNGTVQLSLGVDEVYTLSTLEGRQKGNYDNVPPQKPFPLPYMDDFESYQEFMEPFNLAQQIGAFEVIKTSSSHGYVVRQMVLEAPIFWCSQKETSPFNIIGNTSWSDIYVEVDVYIGTVNATSGAYVATRVNKGGCDSFAAEGVFFFIFPGQGIVITGDLARTKELYNQEMNISTNAWYKMGLLVKDGQVTGTLNGQQVFSIKAPVSPAPQNGFVALGTANYGLADFDNLKITDSTEGSRMVKETHGNDEMFHNEKFTSVKDRPEDTLYFKSQRLNNRG